MLLALAAGTLDTLAGGGGLIVIPGQIFFGVPAVASIANNKCSAFAGTLMASWRLWRRGLLVWHEVRYPVLAAFVGSLVGASILKGLDPAFIERVIPYALLAIASYFALASRLDLPRFACPPALVILSMGLAGAYDGFLGPGTGSIMLALLMVVTQASMTQATVMVKACNGASNVAALIVFAPSALVLWPVVVCLLVGQLAGGWIGALLVERHAERVARPLVIVVSLVMALRLLWMNLASGAGI
ncbi:TSUP family transporter [Litorivicinus lipolyticus]|uniref:TSUP family transporter n=1 Tax=Litorivicinus lipolyticus TaxID=418701 RepID=UPI0014793A89|nr:TSUP family transporter [Litorivicinus lipolyticus]